MRAAGRQPDARKSSATARPCGPSDALIEQGDVIGNVGIGGVFCPRFLQNSARMHEVAAQHVGIALIVEDLRRAAHEAHSRLHRRGRRDRSGAAGHRRRQARARHRPRAAAFSRPAEIALREAVIALLEIHSAEAEIVVGIARGRRAASGCAAGPLGPRSAACVPPTEPVVSAPVFIADGHRSVFRPVTPLSFGLRLSFVVESRSRSATAAPSLPTRRYA